MAYTKLCKRIGLRAWPTAVAAVAVLVAACEMSGPVGPDRSPGPPVFSSGGGGGGAGGSVAGAGFTTFQAGDEASCLDSPNGVNCNNYTSKNAVFMSGGPATGAGLSNGDYFFAVLTPGSQNGGWVDGADGNLSSPHDAASNRTFTVSSRQISSYGGTHATGTSPNGRFIIGLAPFDDTDNPGGVYILAICKVGATKNSDCKFDAFKIVEGGGRPQEFPVVTGSKYYDANANGERDAGEVGIEGWLIDFIDGVSGTITTEPDGSFSVTLAPDVFTFAEQVAGSPWIQTGNLVNQAVDAGGNSTSLSNKIYTVTAVMDGRTDGLHFGNLCIGAGGGRTIGYWSNKNGQNTMSSGPGGMAGALAFLVSLPLRNADGSHFDPASYNSLPLATAFRPWLLSATAVNMAYMLSAQLAAMELNVRHGFVSGSALIYAPGTPSANAAGFASVNDVMADARAALAANGNTTASSPDRDAQEALKNALDNANNNQTFVQPGPASCPTPVFP